MIDVNQAKNLVIRSSKPLGTISVSVTNSEGYVLAEDLESKTDLPLFNNSAMDGFAVNHSDTLSAGAKSYVKLPVVGIIKAGDSHRLELKTGQAAKIMTGALVPEGADTVVRKEHCTEEEGILILRNKISSGQNIRYRGEEIKKGAIGLNKGTFITPSAIGFILELGYREIKVYRQPKLSLLVTGEELLGLDQELEPGKIRDTTSHSLGAAIKKEYADLIHVDRVKDSYDEIKRRILSHIEQADIIIITGGISVGDYDYIKDILKDIGVKKVFWGVSQRPGGPLYFGQYNEKLVFGLPGNPASSLVCFYEYIRPAILKLRGKENCFMTRIEAVLSETIEKKAGKTHFIRGVLELRENNYSVRSAGEQGSHMLRSFALSNCFIVFPKDKICLEKDQTVEVDIIPD